VKAELHWKDGNYFESAIREHVVPMDTRDPVTGGKNRGPSPKELLLASIMGCSGMDVVSLLKKYRIELGALDVLSRAETTDTYPKIFRQIDLIFELTLPKFDRETQLAQAIESITLSMTKYCGVSAMVAPASPIFYTVVINGEIEYRAQADFGRSSQGA